MKILLSFIIVTLLQSTVIAQKTDKKLQGILDTLVANYKGNIGVYIHNLSNNKIVTYNADTSFPTASIVKIPIMLGVINKIERNELAYHQKFIYKDSLLYEGEDILGAYKNNEPIELSKLLLLMLTTSDNTASLWLQSIADGGVVINNLLDTLGFKNTKINSRTKGREGYRNNYGWGQSTPKEMANILTAIYNKKIISPMASNTMLRLLKRQYWDGEALAALPATNNVFSKNGAVNASRSEVLLINSPNANIVISIFTKNNVDISWESTNAAWVLTRKITNAVYNYYNPKNKYNMIAIGDMQKWY